MSNSLVIVESPTKVATIQKILGPGYTVASTKGHFADLPEKKSAVDVADGFAVEYRLTDSGQKVISQLRTLLESADELIIATDADREGEMIGHLAVQFLQPAVPVKRVRFTAITEDAIKEAIANPATIDDRLVMAAKSRRVLDHLWGFHVSHELRSTVRPGVAAGRVQTPALHMIVTREKQRRAFVTAQYCGIDAVLATEPPVTAALRTVDDSVIATSKHFDDAGTPEKGTLVLEPGTAAAIVAGLEGTPFEVTDVSTKAYRRRAPYPYVTSTLLQDAAGRLRIGAKVAQSALQSLFEAGHITYPRTDSPHMAPQAVAAARATAIAMFGEDNVPAKARHPRAKNRNAQEAHEAIRPTLMSRQKVTGVSATAARVYEMIWRRTVASQMNDATGTTTSVEFTAVTPSGARCVFAASGTVIDAPGFRLVQRPDSGDDPVMPEFTVGSEVAAGSITVTDHVTRPPARYTEGTLIKALEEHGIGRPSTYSAIINLLRERYVWSKRGDAALIPTVTAFAVDQVMEAAFAPLVDYSFTVRLEEQLDEIVNGSLDYGRLLSVFFAEGDGTWPALAEMIAGVKSSFDPRTTPVMTFGIHPSTGEELVLRAGKTYRSKGKNTGRPYLSSGGRNVGIADETELDLLTVERARKIFDEPREPRDLGDHLGHAVTVLRGIHGPYAKWNGRTVTLPAGIDLETATIDDVGPLLDQAMTRETNRTSRPQSARQRNNRHKK